MECYWWVMSGLDRLISYKFVIESYFALVSQIRIALTAGYPQHARPQTDVAPSHLRAILHAMLGELKHGPR